MDSAAPRLWYAQPAADWLQALPLGNGALGAMVFGGVDQERVGLNELSLWSGWPQDADRPEAREHLAEIRQLLFAGRYAEAERLAVRQLRCRGEGSGHGDSANLAYGAYQPLGDLLLSFGRSGGEVTDYRRELDLESGIATVTFRCGPETHRRSYFCSAADGVLVVRAECDRPGAVSLTARLRHGGEARCADLPPGGGLLAGRLAGGEGMRFRAVFQVQGEGGSLLVEDGVQVRGAGAVTLLLAAATDHRGRDPETAVARALHAAAGRGYAELAARHTAEHRALFCRVGLDLGPEPDLPTDARLSAVRAGAADPALAALYFQYGRYLLLGSSRPGGLPANLQGIWSQDAKPAWNCDYHTNINVQMNYWPAEVGALPECHTPLLDFIEALRAPGRRTAAVHYGARGWVVHTITNLWGFTAPGEHPGWGLFAAAGAWLCQHLWEHYAFSGDLEYLARAYPALREAAEFYLDFLVEDPASGHLVSGPSNSPENQFVTADGQVAALCMGPTSDHQLIWDLFTNCLAAADALGGDLNFRARVEAARDRLPPHRIGRHGQLQEWPQDFEEREPGHRHISHAFALHPGRQITPRGTPELAAALRATLERRLTHGGGHTGWSAAWLVNLWARLEDGAAAEQALAVLLRRSTAPNLFDLHPPFQIDGNFGGAAGIAEMLLQSHAGEISLLPALPPGWPEGRVRGLRARGGWTVDLAWAGGRLRAAALTATRAGTCRVRCAGAPLAVRGAAVHYPEPGLAEFEAQAGRRYALAPGT